MNRLEVRHASKTYGATTVLSDAHLTVAPGEIHALVGQNGSGKSTLVKILTGYHAPDRGMTLALDGRPLAVPVQWRAARAAGLSVVHQDMGLLGHLSVSENVGIGGFTHSRLTGKIDWKRQLAVASEILGRLQLDVDPSVLVASLPAAHRACVAIARALRDTQPGEGLLVLDEASRALPRSELRVFHDLLRRIAASGTSILMVSHNLEEVLGVADKVTVLRDGRVAGAGVQTSGLSEAEIARLMLGKTVDAVARADDRPRSTGSAASIKGLRVAGHHPLDLDIRGGEIVGVTGLPGTGFEQLPYILGGSQRAKGTITTRRGTVDLTRSTVDMHMRAGVVLVPERRLDEGLAGELSVRDNIALPSVRGKGRRWFVARGWQNQLASESITRFDIKASGAGALIRELSGGNQQKVLLAKWLAVRHDLLILHEPTQAVDVGARADLLRAIAAAAASGSGVLLVSTEPADLVEICDRILVLHPGTAPAELVTRNPDDVLDAVYSIEDDRGVAHV